MGFQNNRNGNKKAENDTMVEDFIQIELYSKIEETLSKEARRQPIKIKAIPHLRRYELTRAQLPRNSIFLHRNKTHFDRLN
jgi:hypothetical protein